MVAGQDNYGIFPGLKVAAPSTLTAGATDSFSMSVTNRGVGVSLNDYLSSLLDPATGYFKNREASDDAETADYQQADRRYAGSTGCEAAVAPDQVRQPRNHDVAVAVAEQRALRADRQAERAKLIEAQVTGV